MFEIYIFVIKLLGGEWWFDEERPEVVTTEDNGWHWKRQRRERFNVLKFKKSMCIYLALLARTCLCGGGREVFFPVWVTERELQHKMWVLMNEYGSSTAYCMSTCIVHSINERHIFLETVRNSSNCFYFSFPFSILILWFFLLGKATYEQILFGRLTQAHLTVGNGFWPKAKQLTTVTCLL